MTEPSSVNASLMWHRLTTPVQQVLVMNPVIGDSWINVQTPVNAALRLPDQAVWNDMYAEVMPQ